MNLKSEPWYIHGILYAIIFILAYVLIRVAIIEPSDQLEKEKYFKEEGRLRMTNLKEAQILWQQKKGKFTDSIDSLVNFISSDYVKKVRAQVDTISNKSKDPFKVLTSGEFFPESLYYSPKSHSRFIVQIDTSVARDTVIDRTGRIVKIDSSRVIGTRYVIQNPDSKDKIGDLYTEALKNTASWE
ncbi:MAG: hypothetical protein CO129_01655 [Ignavibacteriales bacterium CG_4_9_14_3_um_filter_34_10]|nr:MAG: hypothetical protein CO129_01655 [Ignavibacteriales bacterium CG_4_9_14_3_um_filter_34_10]